MLSGWPQRREWDAHMEGCKQGKFHIKKNAIFPLPDSSPLSCLILCFVHNQNIILRTMLRVLIQRLSTLCGKCAYFFPLPLPSISFGLEIQQWTTQTKLLSSWSLHSRLGRHSIKKNWGKCKVCQGVICVMQKIKSGKGDMEEDRSILIRTFCPHVTKCGCHNNP